MRLHLLLATLALAGLCSACGPAPATLVPEATTESKASPEENAGKAKATAPADMLLACSDQMSTGSSTAEEDAAIFARLADVRCPSEDAGAVFLLLPHEPASISIQGGTYRMCSSVDFVHSALHASSRVRSLAASPLRRGGLGKPP